MWPDAWCSACNDIVVAAGGIERASTALRFCCFCDACYERQRARNWPKNSTFERSGSLGPAKTALEMQNRALAARYDLGRYDWNDWEEVGDGTRRLVLRKRATGERLALTVQPIGSFSQKTETWLWSWEELEPVAPSLRFFD